MGSKKGVGPLHDAHVLITFERSRKLPAGSSSALASTRVRCINTLRIDLSQEQAHINQVPRDRCLMSGCKGISAHFLYFNKLHQRPKYD